MPFRVTARTLLQLGAELISSDAIAFYELIKNAFDARSKTVEIDLVIRVPGDNQQTLRNELKSLQATAPNDIELLKQFKSRFLNSLDHTAPNLDELQSRAANAQSLKELCKCLEDANYIVIADKGEGMSLNDLQDVYLTIGTRARLKERLNSLQEHIPRNGGRPILGEKGLGRLSTMRLGNSLKVITSRTGDLHWNELNIDWTKFSHESDELIEDIPIAPELGPEKESAALSGTTLLISALTETWSKDKLSAIARQEFSKLTDPFIPSTAFPISVHFNRQIVPIPLFNRLLFEHSHATVHVDFEEDPNTKEFSLSGTVDYRLRKRRREFKDRQINVLSEAKISSPGLLKSLGPFKMEAYWFNRQILTAIEGIGDLRQVKALVAQWGGGLMVYRDGFRVNPYGSADDDWLELDPKALASGGYKVNRRQIVGKVDLSSRQNPSLVDQTNREGLRDCPEKEILIKLLRHVLETEMRRFLNEVDNEYRAKERLDFDQIERRVNKEEEEIRGSLKLLKAKYPRIESDTKLLSSIEQAVRRIDSLMEEAKGLAESFEQRRSEMVNLAGLGLMVEVIAHELNRATFHTLSTVAETQKRPLPADLKSVFSTLEAQLKTLQRRLRVLDPLSTAGRQRKETFELVSWVRDILDSHSAQFQRHEIESVLEVDPPRAVLKVHAVKGMIVQVLENLISNSVYWLRRQKELQPNFRPAVLVTVDVLEKRIRFTDNGPGVEPERKDEIFQAFVTTKPAGEGKGLGLFISQEIARYNGAHLFLSDQATVHQGFLNTFVLDLEAAEHE
jgi:signal transduction histidine kinase